MGRPVYDEKTTKLYQEVRNIVDRLYAVIESYDADLDMGYGVLTEKQLVCGKANTQAALDILSGELSTKQKGELA